jgi:transposase
VLHVDGYAGFERLTIRGDVVLAARLAHTRRKFYEVVQTADTPLAHEALRWIAGLHAVEAQVRRRSSAHRLAARRTLAKPIVDALQIWLETHPRICLAAESLPRRCGTHSRAGMG